MGFRIMQLKYEEMKEKANIEQGILLKKPHQTLDMNFVQFISNYAPYDYDLKVTTIHEYSVQHIGDGFKGIIISPVIEIKVKKENAIMLIVQYAKTIKLPRASGIRIAGRYCTEGVFILNHKDRILVTKDSIEEEFVALQFEGKMYLVKVHKD